ncbi:stage 0 sporulation protein [Patescibacteria group bacterium]|nr:stage 0 sporulation protein [Patescibacteria group bacterium]
MQVVKVQFHIADKEYFFLPEFSQNFSYKEEDFAVGKKVIVETELGTDIGSILAVLDANEADIQQELKKMLRPATADDEVAMVKKSGAYNDYLKQINETAKQYELKIKIVDVAESFDNQRLTFYFTAESRVDFRDLVKDLGKIFHKKIRLQQIGVRDQAKIEGDYGSCGLPLCCKNWLKVLGNVNAEYIKDQNLMHRGNERLSGACGRLKCCLRYEEEAYKYGLDKLPKVGDPIKTGAGLGRVISVNPLRQTVQLDIDGARVEYPYLQGRVCEKNCEIAK